MQANTSKSTQQPQNSFKSESNNPTGKEELKASSSKAFLREVEEVELEEPETTSSKSSKELVEQTSDKAITARKAVTKRIHSGEKSPASSDVERVKMSSGEIVNIDKNLPDTASFTVLYEAISNYFKQLNANPQTRTKNKNMTNLALSITECLKSYEKNKIPDIFPNFSVLSDNELEDPKIRVLTDQFKSISKKRCCVSLDIKFLNKLSSRLKDKKCIEIYAGNGWLSDELKKRNVDIEATDICNFPEEQLPFVRQVKIQKSTEAVKQFLSQLSADDWGYILLCFPEGYIPDLIYIFQQIASLSNCSIIAIGFDENHWHFDSWPLPKTLIKKDITEELEYTPSLTGERIIMYSFETHSTMPEIAPPD